MTAGLDTTVHHEVVDGKKVDVEPVEWTYVPFTMLKAKFLLVKATPEGERTEWWLVSTLKDKPIAKFTNEDDAKMTWCTFEFGCKTSIEQIEMKEDNGKVRKELADFLTMKGGFDITLMEEDIKKYQAEGKSREEIADIMFKQKDKYLRKDAKPKAEKERTDW